MVVAVADVAASGRGRRDGARYEEGKKALARAGISMERYGLATTCIGVGRGIALVVESA